MFLPQRAPACLHQRQRCPQLMGGVSRKLPLCIERLRQPVQHTVHRLAQLPELGGRVLGQAGVGQAFLVDLPGLPRKIAQRLERPSADKIRDDALSSVTSAVMHQPMRSKRTFSALTC
mgnify:CR=1 FL=1